ncbi:hypothetical protein LAZ67_8000246 [Cordylochernes scorpioides]|uniref:Mos1 transposase HTH domain-containing protein n=1 Tax=Cordylochernes scorpioides TaxID=51811 RepID=A0ABY6KSG8_9ARAC|nr:hypothetical protein LAZ67_8000246 [Cordylochernes scorpioides]
MEMIDLQCSDIIKNKYENSSLLEFYKSLPLTQFDNLHKFARSNANMTAKEICKVEAKGLVNRKTASKWFKRFREEDIKP